MTSSNQPTCEALVLRTSGVGKAYRRCGKPRFKTVLDQNGVPLYVCVEHEQEGSVFPEPMNTKRVGE